VTRADLSSEAIRPTGTAVEGLIPDPKDRASRSDALHESLAPPRTSPERNLILLENQIALSGTGR